MKEIQLTQGYVAMVDDEDFERVAKHMWHANARPRADGSMLVYAQRNVPRAAGGRTTQQLHKFLIDTKCGMQIDHVNRDPLDNRRKNLRVCKPSDNQHNQRPQRGRSSPYKGVYWSKESRKWRAVITLDGKQKLLGSFTLEIDAARAYDSAALRFYGEFARINIYGEDE